ncbi:sulfotransferase family 2 domain-containing protein [Paraurantiacibacter namhicola]|uniref:Sulfotransferase family protein n=1 Tax=Paraurantiacibacter namhicola TaxID=645517 RepID=A0A1C7D6N3_9SPHN|nr:sulfotransferase family 2 domain-containing protein [Paraurantiacibacter namhicola]ANU07115.1 Sulfotransferase family protein [Paraurantiacibacter namhicola]
MIVSHTHRFAFIHIPKCAGTAIRAALEGLQGEPQFSAPGARPHQVLGMLDHAHVPLAALRSAWPGLFAQIQDYTCYAVLRDPVARFGSAFAQHLEMYGEAPIEALSQHELEQALADMLGRLQQLQGGLFPAEMIHFQPQADFVETGGERVATQLYRVDEVDALMADIAAQVGGPEASAILSARPEGNRGERPRGPVSALAWTLAKRVPALREAARRMLLVKRQQSLMPLLEEPGTSAALQSLYTRDFQLWQETARRS